MTMDTDDTKIALVQLPPHTTRSIISKHSPTSPCTPSLAPSCGTTIRKLSPLTLPQVSPNRIQLLFAKATNPRRSLERALKADKLDNVKLILANPAKRSLLCSVDIGRRLREAVFDREVSKVRELLKFPGVVNLRNHHGETALDIAVRQGDTVMVEWLLAGGASPDLIEDRRGRDTSTALDRALRLGRPRPGTPSDPRPLVDACVNWRMCRMLLAVFVPNSADAESARRKLGKTLHSVLQVSQESTQLQEFAKRLVLAGAELTARGEDHMTAAFYAFATRDEDFLRVCLEKGGDPNTVVMYGEPALVYAVDSRRDNIAHMLVSFGAVANVRSSGKKNILFDAIRSSLVKTVEVMLEMNAEGEIRAEVNIREGDSRSYTPLHVAVACQNVHFVELLLKAGASVHKKACHDGVEVTPLLMAASHQSKDILRVLLNHGVDARPAGEVCENSTFWRGNLASAALRAAVLAQKLHNAEFLIEQGANVNKHYKDGNTPLTLASKRGFLSIVNVLIGYKADIDQPNKQGETSLELAVLGGHASTALRFLAQGAMIRDGYGEQGASLLHLAVKAHSEETVMMLVEQGFDTNARTKDLHQTPLHMASVSHDLDDQDSTPCLGTRSTQSKIMGHLIAGKSHINARDSGGNAPLHLALMARNVEAAEILLEAGADIHAFNKDLSTPLHLACSAGLTELASRLLKMGAKVNARDRFGRSALLLAILAKEEDAAQVLVEEGMAVIDSGSRAVSLVEMAVERGLVRVVKALMKADARSVVPDAIGRAVKVLEVEWQKLVEDPGKGESPRLERGEKSMDVHVLEVARLDNEQSMEEWKRSETIPRKYELARGGFMQVSAVG